MALRLPRVSRVVVSCRFYFFIFFPGAPANCPMDSLLQACLFPSLAIEMQCSNGLIHRAKSKDCDLGESPCFSEMDRRRCHEEIDFNDMAAINPELLEFLPLHPYNLPLQENVTTQKQKRRSVNFKIPTPKEGL